MPNESDSAVVRVPLAGLLAWLIPGLGHFYLGHRGHALVLFVTITSTFWTGVAIGGVQETVNPQKRKLWFVAQLCTGGNTIAAYGLNRRVSRAAGESAIAPPHWLSVEVGIHYVGVAGLLNLLVILDAIARADPAFLRTRRKQSVVEGIP